MEDTVAPCCSHLEPSAVGQPSTRRVTHVPSASCEEAPGRSSVPVVSVTPAAVPCHRLPAARRFLTSCVPAAGAHLSVAATVRRRVVPAPGAARRLTIARYVKHRMPVSRFKSQPGLRTILAQTTMEVGLWTRSPSLHDYLKLARVGCMLDLPPKADQESKIAVEAP